MVARDDLGMRADVARRRSEAIKLRLAGATFQQIADSDLYPEGTGRAQAFMDIKRALEEARAEIHEDAEILRAESCLRYDRLILAFWQRALGGDSKAADICMKAIDKRDELLNIKAPLRIAVESETAVDRAIRDLEQELGVREAQRRGTAGAAG